MSDRRVAIEIVGRDGVSGALLAPSHVDKRPVELGSASELLIPRADVAPLHLVLFVKDDRLLVATVDGGPRAFTEAGPLPATWTELALPTHVLVGETVLHLFWMMPFVRTEPARRVVVRKSALRDPRRAKPSASVPLAKASAPPRRPLPPLRTPVPRASETKLHAAPIPRPPPAPSPPRRFAPPPPSRLGDALSGMVIDQTPVLPPSRPSSPTLITDLARRAGVRHAHARPVTTFFGAIAAAWKRLEAFLSPGERVPRSP